MRQMVLEQWIALIINKSIITIFNKWPRAIVRSIIFMFSFFFLFCSIGAFLCHIVSFLWTGTPLRLYINRCLHIQACSINECSSHVIIILIFLLLREGNAVWAMGQTKPKTSENNKYHMGSGRTKYQIPHWTLIGLDTNMGAEITKYQIPCGSDDIYIASLAKTTKWLYVNRFIY